MVADLRASESPVKHLEGGNVSEDRRHERRPLSKEELRKLLRTTRKAPTRWGMTGEERAILYLVASETGYRASELGSLSRANFHLDSTPPVIVLDARKTKNRTEALQPIRPFLVKILRGLLRDKLPAARVFNLPRSGHTADMLKDDLKDAGIPYEDSAGRKADFHALRHTFITNLVKGGVLPANARDLARHSKIDLTMERYTHLAVESNSKALEALPEVNWDDDEEGEAGIATGTDGPLPQPPLVGNLPKKDEPKAASRNFGGLTRASEGRQGGKGQNSGTDCKEPSSIEKTDELQSPRRGAGVADRDGLENRCTLVVPWVRIPPSPPSPDRPDAGFACRLINLRSLINLMPASPAD